VPEPIRVLIADDHELFRRGLRMVLEAEEGMEVVAEATDGVQAVARVEELAPDVVLMDVRMPNQNGIEATRVIREAFPSTRIIMLTVSDEEDDLFDAVKAGANGYLLKEISIEEVADAVRAVTQGQSLISPSMAAKLISEFGSLARRAEEAQVAPSPRLSDRELAVLKRVATGMSNEEIAQELDVSPTAVRNHVANILVKLQLRSRIEAAISAMESRLLESP
jgi:DNA-binding NarL/FixJ family response regulator